MSSGPESSVVSHHESCAQPLIDLTRSFLAGEIDAPSFDTQYRELFATMPVLGDETFLPLDYLFVACDRHVEDPDLFEPPDDLDEDGLRAAARDALTRLGLT